MASPDFEDERGTFTNPYSLSSNSSSSTYANFSTPPTNIPSNVSTPFEIRKDPCPEYPFPHPTRTNLCFPYRHPPCETSIRLKPHAESLDALDSEAKMFENRSEKTKNWYVESDEEANNREGYKDAIKDLLKHRAERMQYVRLGSERLQAAVGEKNDLEFEIPNITSPSKQDHKPGVPHDFLNQRNTQRCELGSKPLHNSLLKSLHQRKASHTNDLNIASPSSIGSESVSLLMPDNCSINKNLHEILLKAGKENGTLKRKQCTSISFHDITPDIATGKFSNTLLGHYDGEGVGQEMEVCEVGLLADTVDPKIERSKTKMETWIWIRVFRPIVSVIERQDSTLSTRRGSPHDFTAQNTQSSMLVPANFPTPTPTSSLIFACPLANVTTYPDIIENSSSCPEERTGAIHQHASGKRKRQQGKLVNKRRDYDFSHQGLPLFEFSNECLDITTDSGLNLGELISKGKWLSVEGMPSFASSRPVERYGWQFGDEAQASFDVYDESSGSVEDYQHTYRARHYESSYLSSTAWWTQFDEGVYADEAKWTRVREAMSRGKCRVVVRWKEWMVDEDGYNEDEGE